MRFRTAHLKLKNCGVICLTARLKMQQLMANGSEKMRQAMTHCFSLCIKTQQACGMISILNIEPLHGRAELGHIWYSPSMQRTKVNTESVYLLLRHLFDDLKYRRAEWKCNNANAASKRAAMRLGFQYEGLFRQHQVVKDENRDTAWFSMLDSEWPRRKANLERWLYEDDSVSLSQLNGL